MSHDEEDIAAVLVQGCSALRLNLPTEAISRLVVYCRELQRWSEKINLIAKKTTMIQIVENHFLDSLILLPFLEEAGCSLLDIGTGAGFPGLVCNAAVPALPLTLVEPRLKRVSFLRHIVRTLGLAQVTIEPKRLEDIDAATLQYTCITSRAVAEVDEFLQMVAHLAGPQVDIICMKGPKWQVELDHAKASLQRGHFVLQRVEEFELPFSAAKRALLFFQKTSG